MKFGIKSLCAAIVFAFVFSFAPAQMTLTPVYTGGNGTQQAATTAALNSLAGYFTNSANFRVSVTIGDLGSTGTLGTSSANFAQSGMYFYATPLFNVVTNTDLGGATTSMTISMNNNASITWGYNAGLPGTGAYSWQSVVMHEVLHSMGFYDGIANNTGGLANAGYTIFDSFTTLGTGGGAVAFTSYTTDAQRLAAITSNNLFWTGSFGVAANGGNPVKLYAPATYESGSTYSHIDPSQTGAGGLLFPALSSNTYFAGPTAVELGIMRDMGWSIAAVPEPATCVLFAGVAALGVAVYRRRRAA